MARKKSERSSVEQEYPSAPDSSAPNRRHDKRDDLLESPNDLESLNDQARRCRRLAGATYDRDVAALLGSMADGFERSAKELSRKRLG